ncbi:unnamed protein product [Timema podura]|uniref:Uncharacterized protein n=1 Tax=Timema podura TaxID=61482 RepID=A0ABN7P522_TIMPD|nr:unnamed protein product [Timema podura]
MQNNVSTVCASTQMEHTWLSRLDFRFWCTTRVTDHSFNHSKVIRTWYTVSATLGMESALLLAVLTRVSSSGRQNSKVF